MNFLARLTPTWLRPRDHGSVQQLEVALREHQVKLIGLTATLEHELARLRGESEGGK